MEKWKEYRLGEVGRIITGKTPRTAIKDNYGGTVPFLTPSDDMACKFVSHTNKTLTPLGLAEVKNCLLPENSICVSCIGSDLGKVVKTQEPSVTNQQINSIIPYKDFDADFVYYLMCIVGKDLNFISKTSTAVPIVNKSTFSNYKVRIPQIGVQKAIGNILSSLDDKIELNRKINSNLEEQAKALFKSWFIDFEPFKDGKFVDSELGKIPKIWMILPFESFISESQDKAMVGFYPAYSVTNNGITPRTEKFKKQLSKATSKEKILRKDDLVFGMSRQILNWGIMQDKIGSVSSAYHVYKIDKEKVNPTYLRYFIKGYQTYFKDLIGTAAREGQSLDKGALMSKIILIPSQDVLQSFLRNITAIEDAVSLLKAQCSRLSSLRDTLLPKLMSGEIEVK
jgi:type I restriction enzyme S subunit